jgi:long-chain fatty acid transport protein
LAVKIGKVSAAHRVSIVQINRFAHVIAIPVAVLLFIPEGSASVAWKPVYGARGSAMGGAVVASGSDATVTIVNPALLVQIEGLQADFGALTFYRPDEISFARAADLFSPQGYPRVSVDSLSVAPYAGVALAPADQEWAFGFGISVPFADQLDWPNTGPNRYWATLTEFSFVYLTPAVAWQVHPKLSIGLGVDYVLFDGKLESAVDFGALAGQPESPLLDGRAVLSGDGTDWGANLGILFSPTRKLDLGLSFLTGVSMTARGTRDVSVPSSLQTGLGFPASITYAQQELDLRMPDTWRFGLAWNARNDWTVVAEIQVLDRSRERFILRNKGSTAPTILPDGEEDLIPVPFSTARSYKAGAEKERGRWAYRFGFAYDENGVPESSVSPAGFDTDKIELTAGFGYRWERLQVNLAYARVLGDDRRVTMSEVANRISQIRANGLYELDTHIITIGLSIRL